MALRALLAAVALGPVVANFRSQLLQAIPALFGYRAPERIHFRALAVTLFSAPRHLGFDACLFVGQESQPVFQQPELEPGEIGL